MRELHWHPNDDEWQYYITGQGRMTVFAGNGTARTFDYRAGDVGYVPFAWGHYIQNTGNRNIVVFGNVQERPICRYIVKSMDGTDS